MKITFVADPWKVLGILAITYVQPADFQRHGE